MRDNQSDIFKRVHAYGSKWLRENKHLEVDETILDLLTEKGVYPYNYVKDYDVFNETDLPSPESFYDNLKKEELKASDYIRAKVVWNKTECKTFGGYHDIYLLTDVLLLADLLIIFQEKSLEQYNLEPLTYFTLPHYGWNAMLLKTGVKLGLISDPDMFDMIESAKRGGIVQVSKKYCVANNQYMNNYDKHMVSNYIMYLDANNLYGKAMVQKLPEKGYKWVEDFKVEDIIDYNMEKSKKGYFIECDIEYPEELHDKHNDYPLAPERMKIKGDMLSPHSTYTYIKACA